MTYKFEDDTELAKEYLKALKEKPEKGSGGGKKGYLKFLSLKAGESADVRVVQIPGNPTFLKQHVHYIGNVFVDGIVIPNGTKYLTCAEDPSCVGEKVMEYLRVLKSVHDFDSEENKKLFAMYSSVRPTAAMSFVCIDRKDGQLKLFQANQTMSEELLELVNDDGNPAHPEHGYDVKLKKKDKAGSAKKAKSSKLTPEEIKMVQECSDPFDYLRQKATPMSHARCGITFGSREVKHDVHETDADVGPISDHVEDPADDLDGLDFVK